MSYWLTLAGMGIVTYATRLSVIALGAEGHRILRWRALRYVPPAVLSALILPDLVAPLGALDLSAANPRPLAALVAAWVARRSGNATLAILAGLGTLWALAALS